MSAVELDLALVEAIKGQAAELRRYRETDECRTLIAQLDERDRIAAMIADQVAAPLRNVLEQEAVVRQLRDRLYRFDQSIAGAEGPLSLASRMFCGLAEVRRLAFRLSSWAAR